MSHNDQCPNGKVLYALTHLLLSLLSQDSKSQGVTDRLETALLDDDGEEARQVKFGECSDIIVVS